MQSKNLRLQTSVFKHFQMLTPHPVRILLLIHIACACITFSPDLNPRELSFVRWNATTLTLSWQPPDVPEVKTLKYEIRVNGKFSQKTDKTEVILSGLNLSTSYKIRVSTETERGVGVYSGIAMVVNKALNDDDESNSAVCHCWWALIVVISTTALSF
uniref:Fibronectin type III domain n=1 Tax=Schistocephalus solidus TaxID=70667 RepID=A0A0X3Q3X6_SCHSO